MTIIKTDKKLENIM